MVWYKLVVIWSLWCWIKLWCKLDNASACFPHSEGQLHLLGLHPLLLHPILQFLKVLDFLFQFVKYFAPNTTSPILLFLKDLDFLFQFVKYFCTKYYFTLFSYFSKFLISYFSLSNIFAPTTTSPYSHISQSSWFPISVCQIFLPFHLTAPSWLLESLGPEAKRQHS